ncbi:MAG: hypothetical protein AB1649_25190 [Chloroflexota bacterium]
MHKTQANQKVRILQLEIAVPADAVDAEVRDEISALLAGAGIVALDSNLLDWRYTGVEREIVASDDPQEGEIFTGNDGNMELPGTMITKVRPMTINEARWLFWEYNDHLPMVIELNDGKLLFPSNDVEGSGPGCLMAMVYQNGQFQDDKLYTYD